MNDEPTAPDQRLRLPALLEYRREAAQRRAAAFVEGDDAVLGMMVKPLTPATFSLLLAHGSHFICGGRPTEGDVRNYLWFHSPLYADNRTANWRQRKFWALRKLTVLLTQPWRRLFLRGFDKHRYGATLALAITDIRRLLDEAWADASPGSGRPGAPLATLEAQLIHEFAAAYQWPPERTRHTPLRVLFQLHRCIRAARGEDVKDAGEQAIIADHIRRRMEAIQAAQPKREGVTHG